MPAISPHLTIPMAAAAVYALSAILLQRAMRGGVGPWRVTFVTNVVAAAGFSLLFLQPPLPGSVLVPWKPAAAGALFFLGQIFTFRALERGDVSVATPVLGLKVLLVALFTTLVLGEHIAPALWVAAGLASAAIILLRDRHGAPHGHFGATVANSAAASALFALADVLVQAWAGAGGFNRFVPVMFLVNGVLSLALLPRFRGRLWPVPRGTWRWMLSGAVLLAAQALGMAFAIATYHQATASNVAYTSRAVWGVVLGWLAALLFHAPERRTSRTVMVRRLVASCMVVAAIVLATRGR